MKGIRAIFGYWAIMALMVWIVGCRSPDALTKSDLPWTKTTRHGSSQTAGLSEVPAPLRPEQKADIQLALAISAERQGRTEEAKTAYEEIIELVPQHVDAHHRLAVLLSRQGECEAAEVYYRRAVQIEPANARLHGDRGYNDYLQEKWVEAEASLRRAIELDDKFTHARNNLGMLLARTGREQEAMQQFAKAGCDRAQATANLALAMALEGRIESAQEAYQRALRHNPDLTGARDMLARLESLPIEGPANDETPVSPGSTNAVVPASHHQHVGHTPNW
jgi:Tfp pilus assembly protein PilF